MNKSLTKKTFSDVIIWSIHDKGYVRKLNSKPE